MMKLLLNLTRRRFSSSSLPTRYLCTAVTEKQPAAPASSKKSGRERSDGLYNRLSALGRSGGSAIDTLNKYFSEGNYARKYELDTCIWQLRRFGKADHALQVCAPRNLCSYIFPHPTYFFFFFYYDFFQLVFIYETIF